VLAFESVVDAASAVPAILRFSPAAVEVMDHSVMSGGRDTLNAGCLLFIEFSGAGFTVERQSAGCREKLRGVCSVIEDASDKASLDRIWGARKAALNNIMKLTVASRKPIGLIEDTVVHPENLSSHINEILNQYGLKKFDYAIYGHAGDGNIHTRPLVDLESAPELQAMNEIAESVFRRVIQSGGSITGEHGDGIARLPYVEMLYGKSVMALFRNVKEIFDPLYILNPNKKVPVRTG
jgi:FAD/FMN-containing dehydrogenase